MIRKYLYGALSALLGLLGVAVWGYRKAWQNASENAREAEEQAQDEKSAREHVQETVEATRDTEESVSRTTDDDIRRELRDEYTANSGN